MGRKKTTGSRYALGEPWDGMLADFSSAHFNAPESQVIRMAVAAFVEVELNRNPDVRSRYEKARAERLGAQGKVAHLKPVPD